MADQWYTFGSGFLLVYSLTDRSTFEEIQNFHREILRVNDRDYVPCVVICNKVSPVFFSPLTITTVKRRNGVSVICKNIDQLANLKDVSSRGPYALHLWSAQQQNE